MVRSSGSHWLLDLLSRLLNWLPDGSGPPLSAPPSPYLTEVQQLVAAHNQRRLAEKGRALARSTGLDKAAQKWAEHMAATNNMAHGSGLGARITAEGVRWSSVGENIAAGYVTMSAVMSGWMASRGHRSNILNPDYNLIGVGIAKSANGTRYWCVDFARTSSMVEAMEPFEVFQKTLSSLTMTCSHESEPY